MRVTWVLLVGFGGLGDDVWCERGWHDRKTEFIGLTSVCTFPGCTALAASTRRLALRGLMRCFSWWSVARRRWSSTVKSTLASLLCIVFVGRCVDGRLVYWFEEDAIRSLVYIHMYKLSSSTYI